MRILLLSDRFPPEVRSSAHLFHDLARALRGRGHDVRVITKVPSKYAVEVGASGDGAVRSGWDEVGGVPVRRVRWVPFLNGGRVVRSVDHLTLWLAFAAASRGWPSVDVALIYSPPLPLAFAGAAYRSWYGTPFVLNVQDLYPQTAIDLGLLKNRVAVWAAERVERAAYAFAERIVVHSSGNRKFLANRKGVPEEKLRVIHNWVDLEQIQPRAKDNGFRGRQGLQGRFVVSFAGLMGYAQDLTTVIRAAELLQGHPEIVFLLVGEGVREEYWKAEVTRRNVRNVRFLPLQSRDGYAELLTASDVCLVPLAAELHTPVVPGKLQSIMASGRAVVATVPLAGDSSRIIEQAECGYAVPPGDVLRFRDAVLRLYKDRSLARQLGENGRSYAERHFSLCSCARAYEQLFEEILARRSKRPV